MPRLLGKKAIITGGNRGIGLAIALSFAREGADIAISYNTHPDEALQTVKEIEKLGRKAIAVKADISKAADREAFSKQAIEFLDGCNILVNNAGVYLRQNFFDAKEEDYDKVLNINLKGAFFFSQLIGKQMVRQNQGGCIINISSFRDRAVNSGIALYQISKAGLTMLSNSLALELAQYGIRVNTISPGMIETKMLTDSLVKDSPQWRERIAGIPLKRSGTAEEVAETAVYLASSAYSTGARVVLDGGRRFGMLPSKL